MSGFYSATAGRTRGVAASFLDKINQKNKKAEEEPSAEGCCTVVLERRHKDEPLSELGLTLTAEAEVSVVAPHSRGAEAKVPERHIIFNVNGRYIESDAEFFAAAATAVNLKVQLYTAADMRDLLAKVQGDDAMPDLEELSRTTRRYGFLKLDHPVYRRWSRRLQVCLDAKRALQALHAEVLAAQQCAEEREAERRLDALAAEDSDGGDATGNGGNGNGAGACQPAAARPNSPEVPETSCVFGRRVAFMAQPIIDASAFGQPDEDPALDAAGGVGGGGGEVSADELLAIIAAAAPLPVMQGDGALAMQREVPSAALIDELFDIVGLPIALPASAPGAIVGVAPDLQTTTATSSATFPASSVFPIAPAAVSLPLLPLVEETQSAHKDDAAVPVVQEAAGPKVVCRPAQTYTLADGSSVAAVVKERRQMPLPTPPVDEPPPLPEAKQPSAKAASGKDNRPGQDRKKTAAAPTSAAPVAATAITTTTSAKPREVCKDFQRGSCTRTTCIFSHIAASRDNGGRPRDRKRSRSPERRRSASAERRRYRDDDSRRDARNRKTRDESRGRRDIRSRSRDTKRDDGWSNSRRRL